MRIAIVFEETESNGEYCTNCEELIIGKMFVMMLQVGDDPSEAAALPYQLCEMCHVESEK